MRTAPLHSMNGHQGIAGELFHRYGTNCGEICEHDKLDKVLFMNKHGGDLYSSA